MSMEKPNLKPGQKRMRALRRARRYIEANEGALARLVNAHAQLVKDAPARAFWVEA